MRERFRIPRVRVPKPNMLWLPITGVGIGLYGIYLMFSDGGVDIPPATQVPLPEDNLPTHYDPNAGLEALPTIEDDRCGLVPDGGTAFGVVYRDLGVHSPTDVPVVHNRYVGGAGGELVFSNEHPNVYDIDGSNVWQGDEVCVNE